MYNSNNIIITNSVSKIVEKLNKNIKINNIKIYSRSATILPIFIDKSVLIHNGNKFISIRVSSEMIGHKFGEFALTRSLHVFKKKKMGKKIKKI